MDHPGAYKFVLNFVHAYPENQELQIAVDEIDAIVFKGPPAENSDFHSGRQIAIYPPGTINTRFVKGDVSTPLSKPNFGQ